MHVAITGSSGLIGTALAERLRAEGHEVTPVVRRDPGPGEIRWDPDRGEIDAEGLRAADAVVGLAGHPIGLRRWTRAHRQRILDSRVKGTRLLAETMARLDDGPRALVTASGINYYGDRGDEVMTERSGPGRGFMTDVCLQWEAAARPAADAGLRVAQIRTGIVQTRRGGALPKQLPLFRLGLGGPFGSGAQWQSWVSLDDAVGLYAHALRSDDVVGPLNATAPQPVTNATYTRTLARALARPALLPVPRFGPRLVFGRMADELLFASMRVFPQQAIDTGYEFRHQDLEACLRDVLGAPAAQRAA